MPSDIYHDRLEVPIGGQFTKGWPVYDGDSTGPHYAPFDLTGCSAMCQVRTTYGGGLLIEFNSDGTKPGLITLTSIDQGANVILTMPGSETAKLSPFSGAVFDLYIFDAGDEPFRVVQGRAHATPEVSDV